MTGWGLNFITSAVILAGSITAGYSNSDITRLGQDSLRNQWHETRGTAGYEKFKNESFFIGIAEDDLIDLQQLQKRDQLSKDLFVVSDQVRVAISETPFKPELYLKYAAQLFLEVFKRPSDGVQVISHFFTGFKLPFLLSLILVLLLHLWAWAPAIASSTPQWICLRSTVALRVSLLFSVVWAAVTGQWVLLSIGMLFLSVTYSHKSKWPLTFFIFFATYLSLAPWISLATQSLTQLSAYESLQKGRTRLEYSSQALDALEPLEKSLWSFFNRDLATARYWVNQGNPGYERSVTELYIEAPQKSTSELTLAFEKLDQSFANQPLIQFNLAQLYTRGQNLVRADQFRAKLQPQILQDFSDLSLRSGQEILWPAFDQVSERWWTVFSRSLSPALSKMGLLPFDFKNGVLHLIQMFGAWILLIFAISRRRRAVGICIHTGDITPTPGMEFSALYQSTHRKSDAGSTIYRPQVDQMIRAFASKQKRRAFVWNLFAPGAFHLLQDERFDLAFLRIFLFLILCAEGLSRATLASLETNLSMPPSVFWTMSGPAPVFFIFALALWILSVIEVRRRANP